MRHITTIKMERLETPRYWRCKPQKDPIVADERVEPFLPRSPTSPKKVSIHHSGREYQLRQQKKNRHLSSLICGNRSWCRTFQSTLFYGVASFLVYNTDTLQTHGVSMAGTYPNPNQHIVGLVGETIKIMFYPHWWRSQVTMHFVVCEVVDHHSTKSC